MKKKFRRAFFLILTALLVLPGLSWGQAEPVAKSQPVKPLEQFAPGQILVKFKVIAKDTKMLSAVQDASDMAAALAPEARQVLASIQGAPEKLYGEIGIMKIRVPEEAGIGQAIEALYRSGTVEFAEPNFRVNATSIGIGDQPRAKILAPVIPNDTSFSEQWALKNTGQTGGTAGADINATDAWSSQTDATSTIVGVIDTGVDYTHADLKDNMWVNPHPGKHGYLNDIYGINAYTGTGDPKDDHGHGTHLAGIMGARGNNGKGIAGVAWKAKIMALKAMDEDGWGWVGDVIESINYALAIKASEAYPRMVLLNGWITTAYSQALYNVVRTARDKGVLFVTGAGNDRVDVDSSSPYYPGGFDLPNIINVSATDARDYWWSNNNGGRSSIDLVAPGADIYSTWLAGTYKLDSGTSQAAAHVAGACALVWAKRYNLDWKQVKGLILNSAEDLIRPGNYNKGCITEGRLNLNTSMSADRVGFPAIFQVTPTTADLGTAITITGINFGSVRGKISFRGYDSMVITSWTNEKITAKVPDDCPRDWGRLTVTIGTAPNTKTSRGAVFGVAVGAWAPVVGNLIVGQTDASGVQIGNNFWLISGISHWGQTGIVQRFALDTLSAMIDPQWMIPNPLHGTAAAAIGNKIYVVGGYNDETKQLEDKLQIFDTVTGTWSRGRNVPQSLAWAAAVSSGGKLYVFGGQDPNNKALNTTFIYNPAGNSWSTGANLPYKTECAATAFVAANKVWLMGGQSESGGNWFAHREVQAYSFAANTWEMMDTLVDARWGAAGISYQYRPFCLNGDTSDGEYYLSSWQRKVWLEWRRTPLAGKIGNQIFILGGGGGGWNPWHHVRRFTAPSP